MSNNTYYNESQIDYNSPLEILMKSEEAPEEHSDQMKLIVILRETVHFILNNRCQSDALLLGVLYSLEDPTILERSTRSRSRELGIASGLIPHYKQKYSTEVLKLQ